MLILLVEVVVAEEKLALLVLVFMLVDLVVLVVELAWWEFSLFLILFTFIFVYF